MTGSLNVALTVVAVETPPAPGAGARAITVGGGGVRRGGVEDDVDPVVRGLEGVGREAAAAVEVDAVGAVGAVGERGERAAGHGRGEAAG